MRVARHWHGGQLLLAWLVLCVGLLIVRWLLAWGVYQVALEDQRVVRVSGLWSSTFAAGLFIVVAAIGIGALVTISGAWLSARKERAARHAGLDSRHRGPLV